MLDRLKTYINKKKAHMTAGLAVAAIIFVMYSVSTLVLFNNISISYGLIYAVIAFALTYVFQRLIVRIQKAREKEER